MRPDAHDTVREEPSDAVTGAAVHGPVASFVGRSLELAGIAVSARSHPLVTITGPGGVGKTRLVLELMRHRKPDALKMWFVDLARTGGSVDVAAEIARATGVTAAPGRTDAALRRYLAARRAMLVLDNCEHVLDPCSGLVAELLGGSPTLSVLATSREPLGLDGEIVWRLEPLQAEEAYRLFVERACQVDPGFQPATTTEVTIRRLCERLDGLPLAIELAAGQLGVMTPAEILTRLESRMALPAVRRALAPARHTTLGRTIEWSYALLEPDEREGFQRLAVFTGGFDAASATDVALGGSIDLLGRLISKSLVAAASDGERTRYRMLETVREFALQELIEARELGRTRALHLQHYCGAAEEARSEWLASGSDRLVHTLDLDYENVRAALESSAEHDTCSGLRLFGAVRNLFFRLGQADGLGLAKLLLDGCPERDSYRVDALIGLAQLASTLMEHSTARESLAEAKALAHQLDDPIRTAWVGFFQGLTEALGGDPAAAAGHLEESLALHRNLGIELGQARALAVLGVSAFAAGDHERARSLLEEALPLYREHEDAWGEGQCLTFLGLVTVATAIKPARATRLFQEAARMLAPLRDATMLPIALVGQSVLLLPGDSTTAIKVTAAACAERERIGGRFPPFMTGQIERIRATSEQIPDGAGRRLWADGSGLDIESAIALAFGSEKPRQVAVGGLSRRETEVVKLVSTGAANKEIAASLHLSVRTIESHVRSALHKLGLQNRTQVATWARERLQ